MAHNNSEIDWEITKNRSNSAARDTEEYGFGMDDWDDMDESHADML